MDLDLNAEVSQLWKISQAWIPMVMQYGSKLLLALVTLTIGWWLINRLTNRVSALLALRNADQALQGFVSSLANIALKVMLIISVASMIGVETTSFVAAIGAAGLAIGLALQGSLSNFAGGVLILLFRPFRIGDWIEFQSMAGTVDNIQIFHTILRTGDNRTVIVPNGVLSNGIITNTNRQPTRKGLFDVKVGYDSDLKTALQVLLEMADDPRVLKDPAPQAVVNALGDTAIALQLRVWTKTGDLGEVLSKFNLEARDRLKAAGVDIQYQQQTVQLNKS